MVKDHCNHCNNCNDCHIVIPPFVIGGITGATGATGATGSTGATGTTGTIGSLASVFGYIYNMGAQVVPLETDILFDSNGILSNVAHIVGASQVVILIAGIYFVSFIVSSENF